MIEPIRVAAKSVRRRWRRNLVSLVVIAAGVSALIVLSSLSLASAEAVTSRLDSATRSQTTALLPGTQWNRDERELTAGLRAERRITAAGTLVAPDRTAGSVVVSSPRSSRTVESAVGVATPSGLRTTAVTVRSGGLGSDSTVSSLKNAVFLGARLARELDYPDVSAGAVLLNGQRFAVLGIIASDEEAWISAGIVLPPESARRAGYLPDQRVVAITTRSDLSEPAQKWIALALSPHAPDQVTILSPPSAQQLRADITQRGSSLTVLIGVIAALSGFLTLAATTFASLTQRRREMGLYLALGYGRSFVSAQIVVEGAIVGALAGIAGLLAGTIIAATVSALTYPLFYFPPVLLTLPASAGALGLLSALLPALAATRVAPSELLRD